MYKHVMVPLDGSELAECVLSHVETITKSCQPAPKITLIRVVTPLHLYGGFELSGVPEYISPEQIQRLEDDSKQTALDYLSEQVKRLKDRGNRRRSEGHLRNGQSVIDAICRKKRHRPDYHCHTRAFRYQ